MGTIPGLQELGAVFSSAGHALCGDTDKAEKVWEDYADESVIGSLAGGLVNTITGDFDEAEKYYKGIIFVRKKNIEK